MSLDDPTVKTYEVKVFDYIDAEQLKVDLTYTTADLSTAMMQQSALFSHYGVLAAKAAQQVDAIKLVLEATEANVYKVVRSTLIATGDKPTEAQLEKLVNSHDKIVAIKRALARAKYIEALGKTASEAFRHRRDMLVQHGLISREEMRGDLRIAARNQIDDVKQSLLDRRSEK